MPAKPKLPPAPVQLERVEGCIQGLEHLLGWAQAHTFELNTSTVAAYLEATKRKRDEMLATEEFILCGRGAKPLDIAYYTGGVEPSVHRSQALRFRTLGHAQDIRKKLNAHKKGGLYWMVETVRKYAPLA